MNKIITKPKLLDQVRNVIRTRHYSIRTEKSYINWIKRFIRFHDKRHPNEMNESHVQNYLEHLAVQKQVSASTQNQARNAILFLYFKVLDIHIGKQEDFVIAKRSRHIPEVLSSGIHYRKGNTRNP